MASFNVFTITCPASTGSATHAHGLGDTPDALIAFGCNMTSEAASAANANLTFGFASSSADGCFGNYAGDNLDTSVSWRSLGDFIYVTGDASAIAVAAFSSMDGTNVTLNWSTVSSGLKIFCLAIGGLDNAAVGQFIPAGGTVPYDQSVTGLGFQPDIVFFNAGLIQVTNSDDFVQSVGVADGTTEASACFFANDADATTSNDRTSYRNNRCLFTHSSSARAELQFKSMDVGGFTVTFVDQDPLVDEKIIYLAIKGVNAAINNSYTQPSSTGTSDCTLTGITPECVLVFSHGIAGTSDVASASPKLCIGAGTSTSNRACAWVGNEYNVGTTNTSQHHDNTKIVKMMTMAGASPTTQAAADISSFSSGKVTFNWTTADATARSMCVVGLASLVTAGAFTLFEEFRLDIADGTHDLDTHTYKVALITSAQVPTAADTTPALGDYTEVSGTGYTAGGEAISVTWTESGGVATFDATGAVTFNKNASGPTNCRYGLLYDSTDTGNAAIGWIDLGETKNLQNAGLQLSVNASGIFKLQ